PPAGYTCPAGKTCTSAGRCIDAAVTPPSGPPLQVSLEISPPAVNGDTQLEGGTIPPTVRIKLNNPTFLQSNHPAVVRYHFAGYGPADTPPDGGPIEGTCAGCGDPPPELGPPPLVKCDAASEFSDHCDLSGWSFDIGSGSLVSQPRTIWV